MFTAFANLTYHFMLDYKEGMANQINKKKCTSSKYLHKHRSIEKFKKERVEILIQLLNTNRRLAPNLFARLLLHIAFFLTLNSAGN